MEDADDAPIATHLQVGDMDQSVASHRDGVRRGPAGLADRPLPALVKPSNAQAAWFEFSMRCVISRTSMCQTRRTVESDSISPHVEGDVAQFSRGNQRDGTEIWVDETGAGEVARRTCRDQHGSCIS